MHRSSGLLLYKNKINRLELEEFRRAMPVNVLKYTDSLVFKNSKYLLKDYTENVFSSKFTAKQGLTRAVLADVKSVFSRLVFDAKWCVKSTPFDTNMGRQA